MGKTPTEITAGSELRDEISMAPSSGIGWHAILSPRYRRAPRRATIPSKLVGSAYPAAAPPPRARSRVRTRPVRFPRTGRTRLAQL